jgi:subtilase family serine protease
MPIAPSRLFAAALALAALSFTSNLASAQSAAGVQHSQGVYHKAVCPGPAGAGNARCHAHVVTDPNGSPIVSNANTGPSGYWPADLQSAYSVNTSGGAGVVVAIVDAFGYPNAEADLATYRSRFGLPPCTTANGCFKKVNQNGVQGSYPRADTGWSQETALDLDMVSAMCPNCKILLVEATSNSFSNLAAAVNRAAIMGAHVISNSYGGGESGSASYEGAYDHPNVAVTVSTGDSGYGVQFPASSDHVIAVGGTTLKQAVNTRGWTETVWSGAGSGCSTVYNQPSWQSGVVSSCSKRALADVSAVADPSTGVAVYGPVTPKRSGWLVFGGTSVSAPLIGGLYGLNGGTVNYGSDPYGHTNALNDVTSGSNGSCSGSALCTAKQGWDGPTGLGTPIDSTAF